MALTGRALFALVSLAWTEPAVSSTPFPRPDELRPAVEFWKQVFAVYDTRQGVVHDRENLGLVYGVESLGDERDRARRQRRQAEIAARYQVALERFARGEADTGRLSLEEWRVWRAHGNSADPEAYRLAAGRVRVQVGQRDRIVQGLHNWDLYGARMRLIFQRHGIPDSLSVLPFVESAFNVQARSHAGAVGLWQITAPAARNLLRVDYRVDERRDPLRSTEAAAAILRSNYRRLGSWPLAITAYNHGAGGVARGVRTVGSGDIVELVRSYRGPNFGFASRNFYVEFLAVLEVVAEREAYFGGGHPARIERCEPDLFTGQARIHYHLETARFVQVEICDLEGRVLQGLVNELKTPGAHQILWDGRDDKGAPAPAALYLVRLRTADQVAYGKVVRLP